MPPRPNTSWPTASAEAIAAAIDDDPDTVVVVESRADPDEAPVRQWADAGVRRAHVELFSVDVAAHDYVAGRPGHADATVRLLGRLRDARVTVVAWTPVHRSTFRGLHDLPRALLKQGVKRWHLRWPHGDDLSRRVPRLGLAVPHALRACAIAGRLGIEVRLIDFPLCVLGPMARAARQSGAAQATAWEADPCQRCAERERCAGAGLAYMTHHGTRELRALTP